MPEFRITGPDGRKYRVTGDNPAGAMAALKSMIESAPPADAPPARMESGHSNVPEFVPVDRPNYNPATGMVEDKRSQTESFVSGVADMASLGFADEAAAFGLGLFTDDPYDKWMARMRRTQIDDQEQNPNSYMAGQITGGLVPIIASGGASLLPQGMSTGGRVLAGGLGAGSAGFAHGFGSGDGLADRVARGGIEGGLGLVVGGALPVVGAGLSAGYRRIADAVLGSRTARNAGIQPEVARTLNETLSGDLPAARQNILAAGPDGMLADAGPNARAVLDTAIQRGGPATTVARDRITTRTARAGDDLTTALDGSLGVPEGVTAARTAIRTGTAPARSAAYDAAYARPIDYASPDGMALEQIVKGRVPASAIHAAKNLMRVEGEDSAQLLARIADDGAVTFEKLPDVRQLDYITRGLNEVADQADGAGKLGGTTQTGRAYQNLASEIRQKLRGIVPEYGTALDTAADPIRRSQALEFGSQMLQPNVARDQVAARLAGMSGAERKAVAQGLRSQIDDLMANVRRTVQDGDTGAREAIAAIKNLSSRSGREKLGMLLGKGADDLLDEVDRIAGSFDLRAAVAENSKTYARQATDQRVKDMTAPGVVGTLAEGKPLDAMKRLAQTVFQTRPADRMMQQNKIYGDMAELLTRPNGASLLDTMGQIGQQHASSRLMAERINRALNPGLAYPSTVLLPSTPQR